MGTRQHVLMKEKLSFGFGDLASGLYWQTFMLYLTYFYTDVFLIPAGAAATMFLLSRVFDGVNDPMMGMLADRTETKWGKFRPYLLWMCVPLAVVGVLTFTVPDFGSTGKLVWAYATFFGIMILYTAINIPYTAMLGVISPNSNERTSVSSIKFLFAYGAGILVSATLLPMVKYLGGSNEAQGWQYSFMIYGALAVIFFLITFRGAKERIKPPKEQKTSIKNDIKDLVGNKPWVILLATTIMFILFVAVKSSVTAHYFKYVVGEQSISILGSETYSFETLVSVFNTIGQISCLVGVLGITWFANKVGKKRAFIMLLAVSVLSTALFYVIPADQILLIYFLQVVTTLTGGPVSVLLWAMYADTADYGEYEKGRRATGLVFSASTMSQKFGWAIGSFIALTLMSSVGFEANAVQTSVSLNGLLLLFSLIPAVLGFVSIGLVLLYPLTDKKVLEITSELENRRKLDENSVDMPGINCNTVADVS